MEEIDDLKLIKKYYGEDMMHLCRNLFPTLLDKKGLLFRILSENFSYQKYIFNDMKDVTFDFRNFILSKVNNELIEYKETDKTPEELLKEVNYSLIKCETDEEIQSFKKYYQPNEQLCTFVTHRLNTDYVFFAIKDNVNNIKRENYLTPKRQDEYGTSVISIQFSKGKTNVLSIKNRYNHAVENPDATFSNNLENIIPGLTRAFEKKYNYNIIQNDTEDIEFEKYVKANDKKYYKYNYEQNNIYYCPDNIIIDHTRVIDKYQKEKERYIFIDYFIVDMKEKTITKYDSTIKDSFLNSFEDIKDIIIKVDKTTKFKTLTIKQDNKKDVIITINELGQIIKFEDENLKRIEKEFLPFNKVLDEINIPNVEYIGDAFLYYNKNLKHLYLPKVKTIDNDFLRMNIILESLYAPNLTKIGHSALVINECLTQLNVESLKETGFCLLMNNDVLTEFYAPNIEYIGNSFLYCNNKITEINMPNLKEIGRSFMMKNTSIKSLYIPQIEYIGLDFFKENPNCKVYPLNNNFQYILPSDVNKFSKRQYPPKEQIAMGILPLYEKTKGMRI